MLVEVVPEVNGCIIDGEADRASEFLLSRVGNPPPASLCECDSSKAGNADLLIGI